MHLLFVCPSGPAEPDNAALALARSDNERITVSVLRPAGLVGALDDTVVILDAVTDPAAARTFCHEFAALSFTAPVLLVVDATQLAGLGHHVAADDIVLVTASASEFRARVRRLAELATPRPPRHVRTAGLALDRHRRTVHDGATTIELNDTEAEILAAFLHCNGAVLPRTVLSAHCSKGRPMTVRHVDVSICRLRRKLGPHGQRIQTVRGVGYRFSASQPTTG